MMNGVSEEEREIDDKKEREKERKKEPQREIREREEVTRH